MRSLLPRFLALVLSLCAGRALAAEVEFVRVWPAWRDAESFDRITEYFTGQEDSGRETFLRTTPDARAGFYYLVRVANHASEFAGATFVLQLIRPDSTEPKTYTFPATITAGEPVFELGLTGPDFPNKKFRPVAWKLELRAADQRVLASQQSFLWAKPDKS